VSHELFYQNDIYKATMFNMFLIDCLIYIPASSPFLTMLRSFWLSKFTSSCFLTCQNSQNWELFLSSFFSSPECQMKVFLLQFMIVSNSKKTWNIIRIFFKIIFGLYNTTTLNYLSWYKKMKNTGNNDGIIRGIN